MDPIVLSRKELYELVWQESMLSLSKRYNISDVGLRKMCIRMEIPVPPAGYWTKVQFGKKVKKTALSANYKGEETAKLRLRDENNPAADRNSPSLRTLKIQEVERDGSLSLQIPEKLLKPDPLIAQTKIILSKQKPDGYNYIGIVSSSYDGLDIRVAKTNVDRALLFFDTLIKAFKARGHTVEIRNRKTLVIVSGHDFELFLREKMRKETVQERTWTRQIFHPKGILALQVGGWYGREYKDGSIRLEEQLAKIIAGLELSAAQRTERDLAYEKARIERAERERLAKELQERKQQDLINFKKLLIDSDRWHKAENLRRYIHELEVRAEKNRSPETQEWLAWAKRKADWYDPFIESPDELLADVDQNTLEFPKKPYGYVWGY
ncbi:hypothetical protein [Flavisolibacter ginsenosidimutans]|uniref:Uncharacterized protein n=1 Tax=Flavisolibacter ginsenosidimutans TaxID=661481 RepID=A0A5B8UGP5_9BACT|nr:hypothetical protein [Flavisolibacter ginsenosidimutans]QEC55270.1 hypothetical protein FSB75_04900 [Flavisolibacter ginsenosidimutans]